MLVGRKRTSGSFGSDGRRVGGVAPSLIVRKPKTSSCNNASMHGSNKLFQPGAKIVVQRAPVMSCLSISPSLQKKFQRPGKKRRAYGKEADLALRQSSLGPKKRFGMPNIMRRSGKGLNYKLAQKDDNDDNSCDESEEDEKENDRPFEPLCVWTSPHQGGEANGLPPSLVTVMQPDEYGVEEAVTVLRPAPDAAYAKENVFVPPVLAKWLRPHQREGVAFMYDCVMGVKDFKGNGCILADDMGLGKTLQSVTLIYTLLKTSITANKVPTAKRVIVVCPCSLVKNWENEFIKWLGPGTVKALAIAEADRKTVEKNIDCFVKTKLFNVLIASYECIRTHVGRLTKSKDCCDLLVCDEAHRLKNNENQTSMALASLPVKRRVLLTGTPMQNDLQEFFAMVDFTNPGVLGTQEEFRKKMLFPILRGREPDATEKQKRKMMDIQNDMSNIVNDFILRRVNTLNAQHLPPKLVQVVCCNLTEMQKNMYQHLVDSKHLHHAMSGKQENCLGSIQMLMKLCNHPRLIADGGSTVGSGRKAAGKAAKSLETESYAAPGAEGLSKFLPFEASDGGGRRGGSSGPVRPEWSGKMFVLYSLMREMRRPGNGNDKIVVVSNYTQTLDLIGRMCRENNWGFCRLDGSITMKKRQKMVDEFNDPSSSLIAFLLSSKAGGCGLNLIGGNRLVLFDPDWNPAVDKQAAARCWRDGQKKRCFTYRFLATGTVEEKIFQRQLSKEGLQSVVDDKEQVNALSTKDLRNLFKLRHGTPSDTHDKLRCERCKIIADNAEAEAAKALPSQLQECQTLLQRLMEHEDATKFLAPVKPEENGISNSEYEKRVKQPMDLGTIKKRLDTEAGLNAAYKSVTEFSKDVNRIFSNVVKVWSPGDEIADEARRLQSWWENEWAMMVPRLMMMKSDTCMPASEENADTCGSPSRTDRGEDFQEQIGMPDEENMRNWSHHFSTDTVDDPVFRAAMQKSDAVSFVFGLEVTWSLIQQRQQEEEEKQAMEELAALEELEQNEQEALNEGESEGQVGESNLDNEPKSEVAEAATETAPTGGTGDDDDGEWTLSQILSATDIESNHYSTCNSGSCSLRPCSLWKSSTGEECPCCLDCQDEEFGGWPEGLEPTDANHLETIAKWCSSKGSLGSHDVSAEVDIGMEDTTKIVASDSSTCSTEPPTTESSSPDSSVQSQQSLDDSQNKTVEQSPESLDENLETRGKKVGSKWACEMCTFVNAKSAKKCKMCATKRPKTTRKRSIDEVL